MMTGEFGIDYEALAQDAMRGIVRAALGRVAALGRPPGEHHFYIAFDTRAPGIVLSKRLKQRYPEEMTIVLQHQFWNLTVDDHQFEVMLSFDGVSERLSVPLRAIRVFFDPSVPYGLQFDSSDLVAKETDDLETTAPDAAGGEPRAEVPLCPARDATADREAPARARTPRKPRSAQRDSARQMPAELPAAPAADGAAEPAGAALSRSPAGRPMLVQPKPDEPANDAKVVQLDKFRKR
jgi:hypothetical protein